MGNEGSSSKSYGLSNAIENFMVDVGIVVRQDHSTPLCPSQCREECKPARLLKYVVIQTAALEYVFKNCPCTNGVVLYSHLRDVNMYQHPHDCWLKMRRDIGEQIRGIVKAQECQPKEAKWCVMGMGCSFSPSSPVEACPPKHHMNQVTDKTPCCSTLPRSAMEGGRE